MLPGFHLYYLTPRMVGLYARLGGRWAVFLHVDGHLSAVIVPTTVVTLETIDD